MRLGVLAVIVAVGAMACEQKAERGGSEQPPFEMPERQGGGEGAAAGEVVEVKMTGDGSTKAAFEPARLTLKRGAKVRFVNESSVPHNVAFWPDSIPQGAAEALNAAMPKRVGNFSSQFANRQGETIEISFADTPGGMYKGYCVPHLALGMTIDIMVQ